MAQAADAAGVRSEATQTMQFPADFALDDYCYLTTTGRRSNLPREIEIWFALEGDSVYLLSGGRDRSHWVRNIQKTPGVTVRVRDVTLPAKAEVLGEGIEDLRAREI